MFIKHIFLSVLAISCLCVFALSAEQHHVNDPVALVNEVAGQAWIVDPSGLKKRAMKGMNVYQHESIATGIGGGLEIEFTNSKILGLIGKGKIDISYQNLQEDNTSSFLILNVNMGTFFLHAAEKSIFDGATYIGTPFGAIYPLGNSIEVSVSSKELKVYGNEFVLPWPSFYQQDFYTRGIAIAQGGGKKNSSIARIYFSKLASLNPSIIPFWSISGLCNLYVPSENKRTLMQVDLNGELLSEEGESLISSALGKHRLADFKWSDRIKEYSGKQILKIPSPSVVASASKLSRRIRKMSDKQKESALEDFLIDWIKESSGVRDELIAVLEKDEFKWGALKEYIENLTWISHLKSERMQSWVKGHFTSKPTLDIENLNLMMREIASFAFLNRDKMRASLELRNKRPTYDEGSKGIEALQEKVVKIDKEMLESKSKLSL